MGTIVDAGLPADQFALDRTLQRLTEATFEVARIVATGADHLMPFVWGAADDLQALEEAVADDPTVETVEVLSELESELLFRISWAARSRIILHVVLEEQGTILDAYGSNERWQFRILFPEHDSVSRTSEFCADHGIDLQVDSVSELSRSMRRGQYGLTDQQFETVLAAFQHGYYDVPRSVKLTDLANDRAVSHQALSERLRRGHETLVENTLRPGIEKG